MRIRWRHRYVRLIRNETNRRFGPATNQGAAAASGSTLVLLNSDAIVTAGWLEPLLAALEAPNVGAAIPKLLHSDGRLQLAGAEMHADGTVTCIGDGDDPDRPEYQVARAVDFGAAACMAIRRNTFLDLGGFDDTYAPAYYEDADLCFALAARGLATRYVPESTVIHERFASGGISAAVALSERNRAVFAERWKDVLVRRSPVGPRP